MAHSESNAEAARDELERVLASSGFAHHERLSRFLRLVVERHLEGRDSDLKESVLGVEVFGRRPDYDPKQDSIVRTEAGRLRTRLAEYYAGEGSRNALVIELPKGGYTPVFRSAEPSVGTSVSRASRSRVVLALLLVVSAAAAGWWWLQRKGEPVVIAVLPLEDLSPNRSSDYFADGLTDEIIRNLSLIDGLAVRSRTSSFAVKGKRQNMHDLGNQLAVNYILDGSVLRDGQYLRVSTQLVRVRDDFPIWVGKFDRELTDVFAIQDEIALGIVNNLRLKLGRGRRRYDTNLEVYDLYLRARLPVQRGGGVGATASIGLFENVVAKDPAFAPAYAGLAASYAYRQNTRTC